VAGVGDLSRFAKVSLGAEERTVSSVVGRGEGVGRLMMLNWFVVV
jgi:hypothetical protein